jgi:hypothetical protein
MSLLHNSARAMSAEGLRVDSAAHPDWVSGVDRLPNAGEYVQCTAGLAQVVRVLGKTGDGSRLLELRLHDVKQPFFVAASNVLLPPDGTRV